MKLKLYSQVQSVIRKAGYVVHLCYCRWNTGSVTRYFANAMLCVVRLSSQRSVLTEAVMTGCSDEVLCRVERTESDDGSTWVSVLQPEVLNVPIALNHRFTQSAFRMSGYEWDTPQVSSPAANVINRQPLLVSGYQYANCHRLLLLKWYWLYPCKRRTSLKSQIAAAIRKRAFIDIVGRL